MARELVNDEALEQVVGGLMNFNYYTQVLTYTHEELGTVTKYKILDFKKAWVMSNELHGQNLHEDKIIAQLIESGYIAE